MKLEVGDFYSHEYEVYFKGRKLNNCIAADEEKSEVVVLPQFKARNFFSDMNDPPKTLQGNPGDVELRWIGEGPDPYRSPDAREEWETRKDLEVAKLARKLSKDYNIKTLDDLKKFPL